MSNKKNNGIGTEATTNLVAMTDPYERPRTNIQPSHETATGRIFIEGLSVLCPSRKRDAIEVGFVKHHHSPIEIKVFEADCTQIFEYICDQTKPLLIEIVKTHPVGIGEFYEDHRKSGFPDEDFRWMPDLEEWEQKKISVPVSTAKSKLSGKLRIQDAVFYTELRAKNDAIRTEVGPQTPTNLPTLGRILGADITCAPTDTGIEIRVYEKGNGKGSSLRRIAWLLLKKSDTPYKIVVGTKPAMGGDHLHMLYNGIIKASKKFELKYVQPEDEWAPCQPIASATEFACQTFGGGDGPLPELP